MTIPADIFRAIDDMFFAAAKGDFRLCGYCRGTGIDPCQHEDSAGAQQDRCPRCGGTGQVYVPPEPVPARESA